MLGKNVAETELQPADDLAVLAGQTLTSLWKNSNDPKYLYNAVVLLEYAHTKSKESYLIKLLLVRLYTILGKETPFESGCSLILTRGDG